MARRGKYFELLDVIKFGLPDALTLQAEATSFNLAERLAGKSFMSYGAMWPRFDLLVKGYANDDFIDRAFSFYGDDWKNKSLRDAFRLLRDHFGGKGRWYPAPLHATYVLGFWFKPSIKGFWFH